MCLMQKICPNKTNSYSNIKNNNRKVNEKLLCFAKYSNLYTNRNFFKILARSSAASPAEIRIENVANRSAISCLCHVNHSSSLLC